MKTVGEILSQKRKKKGLKISAVAEATKIRAPFIKAIEKNDFSQLPSSTTAFGFIKNYAEFLNLSPKYVLAIFRRDFIEDKKGRIIPRGLVKPLDQKGFLRSPRFGFFLLVSLFLLSLLVYLVSQYLAFIRGPSLKVTAPLDQTTTAISFTQIIGQTDPDATVKINGELISLSSEGFFDLEFSLAEGQNIIVIEATSRLGKTEKITRQVTRVEKKP